MREVCTPLTERYIAVDNVCAWPNLTRMPDGAIISTIFSQPCHGLWEGDVECWTSLDEGRTWSYRGTAAPHEPNTNRMNVAAGLAANGDLIVLASGWDDRPTIASGPGEEQEWQPAGVGRSNVLHPWVCRSADGGRTWKRDGVVEFSPRAEGYLEPVPFGDIVACGDGTLGVSVYTRKLDGALSSFFLSSRDDGQTWGECVPWHQCTTKPHCSPSATDGSWPPRAAGTLISLSPTTPDGRGNFMVPSQALANCLATSFD
ncbi:MAG: exo-alpha-sialidase [Lentisphaerae bacterium]|nr:exo-alpha-sialidase [Lentisphaerota bacterium]